jgi:hypothetical protein
VESEEATGLGEGVGDWTEHIAMGGYIIEWRVKRRQGWARGWRIGLNTMLWVVTS